MINAAIDFKEQMTQARRTQILMGAAQLFSKKGYHQASTKEIAEAADVSEGTIYHYFNTKRELLIAMMELLGKWSLEGIVHQNPADDPKTFLTTLLNNLFALLQERSDFVAPILSEILADTELRQALYYQLAQPIVAYIEKYLETHEPAAKLRQTNNTVVAYALIGAVLLNFVINYINLDPRHRNTSVEAVVEQITSIFLDDLRPGSELAWFVS